MARPNKEGLDYFPLDIDIFEDEKIEAIAGEFGIKGELAVIKLLCAVYKKGYFIVWNDLTKATLLKRLPGVSKDLLDQIVARLVAWEFFNEDLFNSAKVLTSENIQAVYFEAIKRRKSPKPTKYVISADINPQGTGVNDDINPQSKVKESKLNQSNNSGNAREQSSDGPLTSFAAWQSVWKFPNTFQQQDLQGLIDQYSDDLVTAAIKIAARKDVKNGAAINFLESVLTEWDLAEVKSLDDARTYEKSRNNERKQTRQQTQRNKYGKPYKTESVTNWDEVAPPVKADPALEAELDRQLAEFYQEGDSQ
ncbi:Lin1244/Lin1753 domain-containing protein [Enterococcus asini]|uniref:Lin1244/Lin1753 domain-containing protein n=1 Tax=Enterococcus asini TaxID=57732 RepID=UPI0026DB78F9|nr:Lin1244/Lin1753 domain-containing protein [Enterococcus asini]